MKIFIIFFLLFCIACDEKINNSKTTTITIWESYKNEEHEIFQNLMNDFEKKYKKEKNIDLKIKIGRVPFDGLLQKLKMACLVNETPDIVRIDIAHTTILAYSGVIQAIDTLSNFDSSLNDFKNKFVEASIQSDIVKVPGRDREEHLYGIPDQVTTISLFWNKKMFKDKAKDLEKAYLDPNRAPQTWDEFIQYVKVLSEPNNNIYAFAMENTLWWSLPFFNTFNADLFRYDPSRKLIFALNSNEGSDALKFKVDLFKKKYEAGAWIPGAINKEQGFINQKYAMIFTGPWSVETFKKSHVDFGISLIPSGKFGTSSSMGGTNMVIFKQSKHSEIAFDVLKHISSLDYQIKWCNALGQIPTIKEAFGLIDTNTHPYLKTFMEQILHIKPRLWIPMFDRLEEIVNPEMELALKGIKTPEKALADSKTKVTGEILSVINR
jgi:multiple sugar transport system substrate-binding protein